MVYFLLTTINRKQDIIETQLLVGVFLLLLLFRLHVDERSRASWATATGGIFTSKGRRRLKPTGNQRASGGRHRAGVPPIPPPPPDPLLLL